MKEAKSTKLKKVWVRMGGYLIGTEEQLKAYKEDCKEHGEISDFEENHKGLKFSISGQTYIPDDEEIEDVEEDYLWNKPIAL